MASLMVFLRRSSGMFLAIISIPSTKSWRTPDELPPHQEPRPKGWHDLPTVVEVLAERTLSIASPNTCNKTLSSFSTALSMTLRDSRVLMRRRTPPVASCLDRCDGFQGCTFRGLVDL
ncbi:hypothetical protein B296_00052355 [Ensete ventricosum]|uniref:Uncharacterized protein n=1 Tax=Ensete ventricosum TaxID=4639 RepID=A0A426XG36_ENSVE|nr:hypothetical protein B296_00052355 [Ensete ventricosum]